MSDEQQVVYVAMDIGCIECGEDSEVIGVFMQQADAKKAVEKAAREQARNWKGEHHFFVEEVIVTK